MPLRVQGDPDTIRHFVTLLPFSILGVGPEFVILPLLVGDPVTGPPLLLIILKGSSDTGFSFFLGGFSEFGRRGVKVGV